MELKNRLLQIEAETPYEAISKGEFIGFAKELRNGCYTFGSTISLGNVKMNKRGNPFVNDVVQKLAKWNFGTNSSYSQRVNNQREREGLEANFVAQPSWYKGLSDDNKCAVGKHISKEEYYLSLYPNKEGVSFVEYYINGIKATELQIEQIKSVEVKSSGGSKSQGLSQEGEIIIRRPKLETILYFVADGRKLKIV